MSVIYNPPSSYPAASRPEFERVAKFLTRSHQRDGDAESEKRQHSQKMKQNQDHSCQYMVTYHSVMPHHQIGHETDIPYHAPEPDIACKISCALHMIEHAATSVHAAEKRTVRTEASCPRVRRFSTPVSGAVTPASRGPFRGSETGISPVVRLRAGRNRHESSRKVTMNQ